MPVVSTIGEKCKKCYACIKSCPARAIKVKDGKASVMEERCISCGHCTTVCSQNAKVVKSYLEALASDIGKYEMSAIVAPSFVVSMPELDYKLPALLKKLGFRNVYEVGFGADLVSIEYQKYLLENKGNTVIATPCHAIVKYIQKYEPELVPLLAPIVSPMVAAAKVAKSRNPGHRVAFIGPCISKIEEKSSYDDLIDYVITFDEFKKWVKDSGIDVTSLGVSDFDEPQAGIGAVYPLSGGLLKSANQREDVIDFDTIVSEGKDRVLMVIDSIKNGSVHGKFVDILFCMGCIDGPKICSKLNYFEKKSKIADYVRKKLNSRQIEKWLRLVNDYKKIALRTIFSPEEYPRQKTPSEEEIRKVLVEMQKLRPEDELNCGACGYHSCREKAAAIVEGLAEKEMCLPYLIDKLEENLNLLKSSNDTLRSTQRELIQKEKLASLGQMASGVAHEINNPLGTVLLYAHMLNDAIEDKGMKEDVQTIITEINRTKEIITEMLNFSRDNKLTITQFDFRDILKELTLKYEKDFSSLGFRITLRMDCPEAAVIEADFSALMQVFSNLVSNSRDAILEAGRETGSIEIKVRKTEDELRVEHSDNGVGIKPEQMPKLFTPFYTTKKFGKGTGLGLPVTYGIIKMHRGKITVDSVVGEKTTFRITLPVKNVLNSPELIG